MKERGINHLLWEIQYEANQDKGYKNNINFRDAFVSEAYVKSGIVHAGVFANNEFIKKVYDLNTNFMLMDISNKSASIKDQLIPSFTTAPIDNISLENSIKHEYVDLFKTGKSFTFNLIHLLPLKIDNDDKDNDWVKKIGSTEIKKKMDSWLDNKDIVYLENFLTNEIKNALFDENITNNFHAPIFLISNIELDNFNKVKVIDKINIYAGLIDSDNKKLNWIKASHNFLEKKNVIHYKPIDSIDVHSFDVESIINARNISIKDNEFISYSSNEQDGEVIYNLLDITKTYVVYGDINKWSFGQDERFSLNDKKIPEQFSHYHEELYNWVEKINKK